MVNRSLWLQRENRSERAKRSYGKDELGRERAVLWIKTLALMGKPERYLKDTF